jgi:hypothetical protein
MTRSSAQNWREAVRQLHELYCRLTGQNLTLRFDRERLWYDFLQAGFSAADLHHTILYLQKEIRAQRRNIGSLKLSNLLQLDRFEEDLHISRARLKAPALPPKPLPQSTPSPPINQEQRTNIARELKKLRRLLRHDF